MWHGALKFRGRGTALALCLAMRAPLLVLGLSLCAVPGTAQEPARDPARTEPWLATRLPTPLIYLVSQALDGSEASPSRDPLYLARLGLRLVQGEDEGDVAGLGGSASAVLQRLLQRAGGEIELAFSDLLPREGRPGLPVLVFRAGLDEATARSMAEVLGRGELSRSTRTLDGHSIHALGDAGGSGDLEVCLIGRDLIVANHSASLDAVLTARRAGTSASRETLALNRDYQTMRGRLAAEAGTVTVFADWKRVQQVLAPRAAVRVQQLADWFGLTPVRSVMLNLNPQKDGVQSSICVARDDSGEGWLNWIAPARGAQLQAGVPRGSLGGAAFHLDLERVLRSEVPLGFGRVRATPRSGFRAMGLDLERSILRRLSGSASVQLLLVGTAEEIQPAYTLRAKDRSAAAALYGEIRRNLLQMGLGVVRTVAGGVECLAIHMPQLSQDPVAFLTVADDALLLGLHAGTLPEALAAMRGAKSRGPGLQNALQRLGAGKQPNLGAVFSFELPGLAANAGEPAPAPSRHHGALRVEDGMVRIDVFSQS